MKICLINPPTTYKLVDGEEWSDNSLCNSSYLGLRYLEEALLRNGFEVNIYDCPYGQIELKDLKKILLKEKYDYVGLSCFYYNLVNVERIITYLEILLPNSFVFLGGYAVTLDSGNVLKSNAFVKLGFVAESENSMVELFENIKNGIDWRKTKGIAYIDDGQVIMTDYTGEIDLDKLHFPKHLVSSKSDTVSVLSSRGCYGNCSFCSEKEFYRKNGTPVPRYRSVDNLLEELKEISLQKSIKSISFADSNFMPGSLKRQEWLKQLVVKLKENRLNFKYRLNTRANDVIRNKEIIPLLKEVGFLEYFIGVESFSQSQLDLYNKYVTAEQNIEALQILSRNQIKIEIGFLPIEPYATIDEIRESIETLLKIDLFDSFDYTQEIFSLASKLFLTSGTRIAEMVSKDGLTASYDIGYKFMHPEVEEYYNRLENWKLIIAPYVSIRYMIDKANRYLLTNKKERLIRFYLEILKADVCIMRNLLDFGRSANDIMNQGEEQILKIWDIYKDDYQYVKEYC